MQERFIRLLAPLFNCKADLITPPPPNSVTLISQTLHLNYNIVGKLLINLSRIYILLMFITVYKI